MSTVVERDKYVKMRTWTSEEHTSPTSECDKNIPMFAVECDGRGLEMGVRGHLPQSCHLLTMSLWTRHFSS